MEINDTASYYEDMITFSDQEIAPVKAALKTKLFRSAEPESERVAKFQAMVTALSDVFGIPEPRFVKDPGDEPGEGRWNQEDNTIHVQRFSLTTTLFCFGVAVLFHKYGEEMQARHARAIAAMLAGQSSDEPPIGYPPMAFGLSMFKQAAPRMFDTAKNAGRLVGVNVPYTDGGRLNQDGSARESGEHVDEEDAHEEIQNPPRQIPDIDPELRNDTRDGSCED